MRTWSVKTISITLLLAMLVAVTALVGFRRAQAAGNLTIYREFFWHSGEFDGSPITRYEAASFGVEFDFRTNYKSQVGLIAFLLYGDEPVPAASYCQANNGRMPPAHPERNFWSTGYMTSYSQGRNFFSQTYNFVSAPVETSHLISWLLVRDNKGALTYCAQQVYPFSDVPPSVIISD